MTKLAKTIDFEEILSNVLLTINKETDNPYEKINMITAQIAANTCIKILKEYHKQVTSKTD